VLGDFDGEILGLVEALADGDLVVGLALGVLDGDCIGLVVGDTEGLADGDLVAVVGLNDSEGELELIGDALGVLLGDFDGEMLGLDVGLELIKRMAHWRNVLDHGTLRGEKSFDFSVLVRINIRMASR
jgi:hypothetical protein